jgi:hypothetical protein
VGERIQVLASRVVNGSFLRLFSFCSPRIESKYQVVACMACLRANNEQIVRQLVS